MPTHINDGYINDCVSYYDYNQDHITPVYYDHTTEVNTEAPVLVGGPVYYVREYPEGAHIRLSDLVRMYDVPFGVYSLADDDTHDDGRDGERGNAFEEVFS